MNRKNYQLHKSGYGYEYDGITIKMLKASDPYICSPLNYICNESLSSGTFPSRLKYSIVKPLIKKGDRDNVATNYIS
jgi:hypothetical protein